MYGISVRVPPTSEPSSLWVMYTRYIKGFNAHDKEGLPDIDTSNKIVICLPWRKKVCAIFNQGGKGLYVRNNRIHRV